MKSIEKIRKTFADVAIVGAALGALAAAFGTASGCAERPPNTIRVAYLPITHALVAVESAKTTDVSVELTRYGSWPELFDALNSGRVDAASALIEPAMKAKAQGVGLTAIALGHRDGNAIVVANEIQSARELRGKTLAIPHRTSTHYALVCELLEQNGLKIDDVRLVELPPQEAPSALATGRIAGFCAAEPFGAVAVQSGAGKVLCRSEELWPDSICCALIVNDRFLKKNRALVERYAAAYRSAGERLRDPKETLAIAKTTLSQSEDALKESLDWISFDDLELESGAYDSLCEKVEGLGILDAAPKYGDFVDNLGGATSANAKAKTATIDAEKNEKRVEKSDSKSAEQSGAKPKGGKNDDELAKN